MLERSAEPRSCLLACSGCHPNPAFTSAVPGTALGTELTPLTPPTPAPPVLEARRFETGPRARLVSAAVVLPIVMTAVHGMLSPFVSITILLVTALSGIAVVLAWTEFLFRWMLVSTEEISVNDRLRTHTVPWDDIRGVVVVERVQVTGRAAAPGEGTPRLLPRFVGLLFGGLAAAASNFSGGALTGTQQFAVAILVVLSIRLFSRHLPKDLVWDQLRTQLSFGRFVAIRLVHTEPGRDILLPVGFPPDAYQAVLAHIEDLGVPLARYPDTKSGRKAAIERALSRRFDVNSLVRDAEKFDRQGPRQIAEPDFEQQAAQSLDVVVEGLRRVGVGVAIAGLVLAVIPWEASGHILAIAIWGSLARFRFTRVLSSGVRVRAGQDRELCPWSQMRTIEFVRRRALTAVDVAAWGGAAICAAVLVVAGAELLRLRETYGDVPVAVWALLAIYGLSGAIRNRLISKLGVPPRGMIGVRISRHTKDDVLELPDWLRNSMRGRSRTHGGTKRSSSSSDGLLVLSNLLGDGGDGLRVLLRPVLGQ